MWSWPLTAVGSWVSVVSSYETCSVSQVFLSTKFQFYDLGNLTYGTSFIYLHFPLLFVTLSTRRTYRKVYPSLSIITVTRFCLTLLHWYADSWQDCVKTCCVVAVWSIKDTYQNALGYLLTVDRKCRSCAEWHVTSPDLVLHVVIF
jgi:hypothetical protein